MNDKDWENYITYYCVILRKYIRKLIFHNVKLDCQDNSNFNLGNFNNKSNKLNQEHINSKILNSSHIEEILSLNECTSNNNLECKSNNKVVGSEQKSNTKIDKNTDLLSDIKIKEISEIVYNFSEKNTNLLLNLALNFNDCIFVKYLKSNNVAKTAIIDFISIISFYFGEYANKNIETLLKKKTSNQTTVFLELTTIFYELITNAQSNEVYLINNIDSFISKILLNIVKKFDLDMKDLLTKKHDKVGEMKIDFKGKIRRFHT